MDFKILYDLYYSTLKLASMSTHYFYLLPLYFKYEPERTKSGFYTSVMPVTYETWIEVNAHSSSEGIQTVIY